MAYDEYFAERVRVSFTGRSGFQEKKMFGGVCFLLNGNMACGVLNDDLIVRVGPDDYEDSLKQPDTRVFDITGRVMQGWVMVSANGCRTDRELASWIGKGISFAETLPPK